MSLISRLIPLKIYLSRLNIALCWLHFRLIFCEGVSLTLDYNVFSSLHFFLILVDFCFSVMLLFFFLLLFNAFSTMLSCFILILKIVLGSRELFGNLSNILILYKFSVTTTNQMLAKLLYL